MTHQSKAACKYPRGCGGAAFSELSRWSELLFHGEDDLTYAHKSLTGKLKDLITGLKLMSFTLLYFRRFILFYSVLQTESEFWEFWRALKPGGSPSSLLTSVFALILFAKIAAVKPGPLASANCQCLLRKASREVVIYQKFTHTDGLRQMWLIKIGSSRQQMSTEVTPTIFH